MDSYTKTFVIKTSAQKLYEAITTKKGLASWWTQQVEIYPQVGGIATFHFGKDMDVVMKLAKLVPQKEVIWKCVEQYFPVKGTDKTDEWVGTTIKFTILENPEGTTLVFAHEGMNANLVCYNECHDGWDYFMKSLKRYLETGEGTPFKEKTTTSKQPKKL